MTKKNIRRTLLAAIGLFINRKQPWAIVLIVRYNVALSQCFDLDVVASMHFNEAFKPEFTCATAASHTTTLPFHTKAVQKGGNTGDGLLTLL